MKPLEPPDSYHLRASEGWLELGNAAESLNEIANIAPENQNRIDVLLNKWNAHLKMRDWTSCVAVSKLLIQLDPNDPCGWINQSNALFFSGSPEKAYAELVLVADRFPFNPSFPYNLSCYLSQMMRLDEAWTWFKQALQVGDRDKIISLALNDPDLKPIWNKIQLAGENSTDDSM